MTHILSPLLADLFAAFASSEAQAGGLSFDRRECAVFAEGLREMMELAAELERQRDQLIEALAEHYADPDRSDAEANVINLAPYLAREVAANQPGGAA